MKKILFFAGIILAIAFIGCNKPKITCEIVKPSPNATFELGEIIELAVTVEVENTTIDEVQIYLDDAGYSKKNFFPFNFQISTHDLEKGAHTIRVVAIASSGAKDEKTVSFTLAKYESPDFVSFSDGILPVGWKSNGWTIFSPGYDDNYALRSSLNYYSGGLTAIKTCNTNTNCIEFYAKSDSEDYWYTTRVGFSIDDNMIDNITLTTSWKKYSYNVTPGEHTFRWWITTSGGGDSYCYLDAIKFFKRP